MSSGFNQKNIEASWEKLFYAIVNRNINDEMCIDIINDYVDSKYNINHQLLPRSIISSVATGFRNDKINIILELIRHGSEFNIEESVDIVQSFLKNGNQSQLVTFLNEIYVQRTKRNVSLEDILILSLDKIIRCLSPQDIIAYFFDKIDWNYQYKNYLLSVDRKDFDFTPFNFSHRQHLQSLLMIFSYSIRMAIPLKSLTYKINVDIRDDRGNTALIYAIKGRNLEMVQELIAYGADVNVINFQQITPLSYCIDDTSLAFQRTVEEKSMSKRIFSYLISIPHIDLNQQNGSYTPLSGVSNTYDRLMIRELLEMSKNRQIPLLLHESIYVNFMTCIQYLSLTAEFFKYWVELKCDINFTYFCLLNCHDNISDNALVVIMSGCMDKWGNPDSTEKNIAKCLSSRSIELMFKKFPQQIPYDNLRYNLNLKKHHLCQLITLGWVLPSWDGHHYLFWRILDESFSESVPEISLLINEGYSLTEDEIKILTVGKQNLYKSCLSNTFKFQIQKLPSSSEIFIISFPGVIDLPVVKTFVYNSHLLREILFLYPQCLHFQYVNTPPSFLSVQEFYVDLITGTERLPPSLSSFFGVSKYSDPMEI